MRFIIVLINEHDDGDGDDDDDATDNNGTQQWRIYGVMEGPRPLRKNQV